MPGSVPNRRRKESNGRKATHRPCRASRFVFRVDAHRHILHPAHAVAISGCHKAVMSAMVLVPPTTKLEIGQEIRLPLGSTSVTSTLWFDHAHVFGSRCPPYPHYHDFYRPVSHCPNWSKHNPMPIAHHHPKRPKQIDDVSSYSFSVAF